MERRRSVLGEFVAWEASGRRLGTLGGVMHGSIDVEYGPPHDSRTLLNLPKVLFACSIPFDTVFVGWVEKSGGGLSSGGIQFAKDVEILPANDEAVVVGVWMFAWRGDDWSGTTWRCHTKGFGRIGRYCIGPGIAKSRPGESG